MTSPTYPTPPQPPLPEPKRWRIWPLFAFAVVVAFFLGLGAGRIGASPASASSARAAAPATVTVQVPVPTLVPAPTPPPPPVPAPVTSWGDGTHLVPQGMPHGTYRTVGAEAGLFELCTITTRAGASTNSEIVDIANGNANEAIVMDVGPKVKAVTVRGCEPLTKIG